MRIGLTYTGSNKKHENYKGWLKADEDIEIIPLFIDRDNLADLKTCDALVLSGGLDIHPRFYGNNNANYPNPPESFNEQRDEREIAAFGLAQENGLPVLGICRGLQLINCVLKGNLEQDLGEVSNMIHRAEKTRESGKVNDKAHGMTIETGTLLYEIIKTDRGVVNSAHHQSIEKLGKGLKVNCISDDGIIEGIEWEDKKDKPFMLAIQWHPERMKTIGLQDSKLSKGIRDLFIEEIKKATASKV